MKRQREEVGKAGKAGKARKEGVCKGRQGQRGRAKGGEDIIIILLGVPCHAEVRGAW